MVFIDRLLYLFINDGSCLVGFVEGVLQIRCPLLLGVRSHGDTSGNGVEVVADRTTREDNLVGGGLQRPCPPTGGTFKRSAVEDGQLARLQIIVGDDEILPIIAHDVGFFAGFVNQHTRNIINLIGYIGDGSRKYGQIRCLTCDSAKTEQMECVVLLAKKENTVVGSWERVTVTMIQLVIRFQAGIGDSLCSQAVGVHFPGGDGTQSAIIVPAAKDIDDALTITNHKRMVQSYGLFSEGGPCFSVPQLKDVVAFVPVAACQHIVAYAGTCDRNEAAGCVEATCRSESIRCGVIDIA